MKILHIITRLDCGGSAENTLLTAIGSRRAGHTVGILCGVSNNPPSENEKKALDLGISIECIKTLSRSISPLRDALAFLKLYRRIRRFRCDILHTHTSKTGILGRFAGKLAGVRRIVHTPHGHIFYGYFSQTFTNIFIAAERAAGRVTNALITLTQAEKQDYLDRKIQRPETIYPVFSGIELSLFLDAAANRSEIRLSLGVTPGNFVVVTAARLVSIKNHELIIRAAQITSQKAPEVKFVFIGDGDRREELESLAENLNVSDSIFFAGWRTDVPDILAASDLFVMCSKNEGMGRAFVEAQAAGLPVIGSRVSGIPEVLKEGITGFLVDADNPGELAEKVLLLHDDKELYSTMKRNCRSWVDPQFSVETMVEKIHAIYGGIA